MTPKTNDERMIEFCTKIAEIDDKLMDILELLETSDNPAMKRLFDALYPNYWIDGGPLHTCLEHLENPSEWEYSGGEITRRQEDAGA